jgi:putative sigma-54 modulation protein
MDVKINATNVSLSGAIERHIHEKLSKLNRYLPNISSVTVDLKQQKTSRGPDYLSAEITIRHARGAILRAEKSVTTSDNLFHDVQAVVNEAVDNMYRRISRFKGKRRDRRERAGRFMATLEELNLAEDTPDELEAELANAPEADQLEPRIYRRKVVPVSPMTEDEAIEQMELLGHTFFVFYHAERDRINVLYKRSNGGYGVIDPQLA